MINPMIFYWISICDVLKNAILAFTTLSGLVLIFDGIVIFIDLDYNDDTKNWKIKLLKICVITLVVGTILTILIPGENTLIKILIADNLTAGNIESATQFVIDALKKLKE